MHTHHKMSWRHPTGRYGVICCFPQTTAASRPNGPVITLQTLHRKSDSCHSVRWYRPPNRTDHNTFFGNKQSIYQGVSSLDRWTIWWAARRPAGGPSAPPTYGGCWIPPMRHSRCCPLPVCRAAHQLTCFRVPPPWSVFFCPSSAAWFVCDLQNKFIFTNILFENFLAIRFSTILSSQWFFLPAGPEFIWSPLFRFGGHSGLYNFFLFPAASVGLSSWVCISHFFQPIHNLVWWHFYHFLVDFSAGLGEGFWLLYWLVVTGDWTSSPVVVAVLLVTFSEGGVGPKTNGDSRSLIIFAHHKAFPPRCT